MWRGMRAWNRKCLCRAIKFKIGFLLCWKGNHRSRLWLNKGSGGCECSTHFDTIPLPDSITDVSGGNFTAAASFPALPAAKYDERARRWAVVTAVTGCCKLRLAVETVLHVHLCGSMVSGFNYEEWWQNDWFATWISSIYWVSFMPPGISRWETFARELIFQEISTQRIAASLCRNMRSIIYNGSTKRKPNKNKPTSSIVMPKMCEFRDKPFYWVKETQLNFSMRRTKPSSRPNETA